MSTTAHIIRAPGTMMHNPPHPGTVLQDGWVAPLELTVTAAADALGVTRKTLSAILNTRAGISAELALQLHYDLWHAKQHTKLRIAPWPRPRAVQAQLRHSARAVSDVRVAGRPRRAKPASAEEETRRMQSS